MWENVNLGLRKWHLKTKSKIFFLLFFVVGSLCCYSLPPEEVEALKGLSPEVLISIILIYDKAQNDLDSYLEVAEQGLVPVLVELQKVRALLTKQETESALQDNLLAMLLNQHKLDLKSEYERGLKAGITFGSIGGGLFSGAVAIGISRIE